jgi:glycine/D-amino acid oxidase-like deaminating enzyme
MKYDYLIIGQGLAGSVMAYQLHKRGKSVAVIDEQKYPTSSRVAAGLANPLTGPRMAKTWKAELLFPYMENFYEHLQQETRGHFFKKHILYRPFISVKEMNDWDGRSEIPNDDPFIHKICEPGTHNTYIRDPFGGVEVYAHTLNVRDFITEIRRFLDGTCDFYDSFFEEDKLEIFDNYVKYAEIEATNVIFCTGHSVVNSRYFGWLPMAPLKGEILEVKIESDFKTIYNRSCFIIPMENGRFKVGSTYDRQYQSQGITERGKNEICEKLEALCTMSFEVTHHEAGIRPATLTRRPLMGTHPVHKCLHVFNGLGTKGVTLAPFFSDHFVKSLEEGNYVEEEVDIKKYYSLYFKSDFDTKVE